MAATRTTTKTHVRVATAAIWEQGRARDGQKKNIRTINFSGRRRKKERSEGEGRESVNSELKEGACVGFNITFINPSS
jgi:hypothetical protein